MHKTSSERPHVFPPMSSWRQIAQRRRNRLFPLSLMTMLIMSIYIIVWLRWHPEVVFPSLYYPLYRRIVMFLTSLVANVEAPQDPLQVHSGTKQWAWRQEVVVVVSLPRSPSQRTHLHFLFVWKEKFVFSKSKNPLRFVTITLNCSNTKIIDPTEAEFLDFGFSFVVDCNRINRHNWWLLWKTKYIYRSIQVQHSSNLTVWISVNGQQETDLFVRTKVQNWKWVQTEN